MKDPAEGTATVVGYEAFTTPGLENNTRPGFEVTLHAQVVVQAEGGTRREAMGRRIPLGEGLVGQVARAGQMGIVREASVATW